MCDIRWAVAFLISAHLLGTGERSKIVSLAGCRGYLLGRTPLRVGLAEGAQDVTLTCPRAATLRLDGKPVSWAAGEPLRIAPDISGAAVRTSAGEGAAQTCLLEPVGGAATEVSADGSSLGRYSGSVEIGIGANGMKVVSRVALETYLLGVVPAEMPASFPREALKAQAIVARTYALYQLGAHESEGFDVCAGTHCQVYRGSATSPRTTRAVKDTSGQVLAMNGVLVKAVYHSTCGGTTSDAWKAWWGHLLPYLRGRPDGTRGVGDAGQADIDGFLAGAKGWCRASSKYRWQVEMAWPDVQEKVAANLAQVTNTNPGPMGQLLDLRVADRDVSGRVRRLVVVTDTGEHSVWADSVRWLFGIGKPGPGGLPSTLLTLTVHRQPGGTPTRVTFQGAGWGHGIGLCQMAAAARARAGQNAQQILGAYYTGLHVVKAR